MIILLLVLVYLTMLTMGHAYYKIDVPNEATMEILVGHHCALCNINFGKRTGDAS